MCLRYADAQHIENQQFGKRRHFALQNAAVCTLKSRLWQAGLWPFRGAYAVCLDSITLFFYQTQAEYTHCRGIIYYARTFHKKRIFLIFRILNALSERADIMNYVPTRAAFSFVHYVSFILFSSKQTADWPPFILRLHSFRCGACALRLLDTCQYARQGAKKKPRWNGVPSGLRLSL